MHIRPVLAFFVASVFVSLGTSDLALAQGTPPPTWGWPPPGTAPTAPQPTYGGYGPPQQQYPMQGQVQHSGGSSRDSSEIEIGTLYVTSAAYGVGLGVWFDSETGFDDPGLKFIPPVALGLAAPVGVFFLDQPAMPRGMPAAISAGLMIGAGEGLGIWSYQYTSTDAHDSWGFRGLARSMTLGSTLGGIGGFALAVTQEPSPKTSVLLGSATIWGTVVGSMMGYGSTSASRDTFGTANEGASLGGLIGFNVGLGAAAAVSTVYVPSWSQLGWMWAGGGVGTAVGLPIYLAYAGSDKPAKRGLVFQGITTGLGIAAGAIFSSQLGDQLGLNDDTKKSSFAQITGLGLMPLHGGAGVQMMGLLY